METLGDVARVGAYLFGFFFVLGVGAIIAAAIGGMRWR